MRRAACACPGPLRSTVGDEELATAASLTQQQWQQAHDSTGKVQKGKYRQTCKAIRNKGLTRSVRSQAWPLLLGCYTPTETEAETQAINNGAQQEYALLLQQAAHPDAHDKFQMHSGGETWEQNVRRITNDVNRADRGPQHMSPEEQEASDRRLERILTAYAYCDPLVGYCQGMADILSPFLVVYPDSDALAFMCFASVLGQIRQNFLEGQPGVHASIQHVGSLLRRVDAKLWRQIEKLDMSTGVFAFRMLVCQFRREMTFDDVFGFWERLWAAEQLASCQLKDYCIAALLRRHRKQILRLKSPEDFIQFVNKDIVPIDGPAIVKAAYKMWKQTGSKQKPQANGEAWQRLSKAEANNVKTAEPVAMHAQNAPSAL